MNDLDKIKIYELKIRYLEQDIHKVDDAVQKEWRKLIRHYQKRIEELLAGTYQMGEQ